MAQHTENILNLLRAGEDQKAVTLLYKVCFDGVKIYVRKNSGTLDQARDVFHEAILRLYTYLQQDKLTKTKSIEGLVYTIARNLWNEQGRTKSRRPSTPEVEVLEANQDTSNALSLLLSKEKSDIIKNAFLRLDEKCRDLLRLTIIHSTNLTEVAKKLGYNNADVVKAKNYRCKKRLKDIIIDIPEMKELLV